MRGFFISLEGTEGAGKSSAAVYLAAEFKKYDIDLLMTREPGGTKIAEQIRILLLENHNPNAEQIHENAELLLMFAARIQHIEQIIKPALSQNKLVICDRFIDATYAYQGGGRNISSDKIETLQKLVMPDLLPDLTLLFDLPVEIGLERANKRSMPDRFESEQLDFFKRVREIYLKRANADSKRIKIVDSCQSFSQIQQQLSFIAKNIAAQLQEKKEL